MLPRDEITHRAETERADPNQATHRSGSRPPTVRDQGEPGSIARFDRASTHLTGSPSASIGGRFIPSSFGDYELLEELGRGGMGIVFLAKQVGLNRTIALKTILAPHLAASDQITRFKREAEAAAKLDHPGIVAVYDSGTVDNIHYFSMAYVDGGSLSDRLRQGLFNQQQAVQLLIAIADAVAYAHDQGVVHRDLKPSNVLLNQKGDPLVADFGLAKIVSLDAEATVSGRVLGTPSYMSPEQAAGNIRGVGPHTDIYSLGAILYRLLTGRPPFQEDTISNTIRAVLDQEPLPPRNLRPGIERDLETICMKCLEKEVADRYQTVDELKQDLQRFANDQPIKARPVSVIRAVWRWYTGRQDSSALVAGGYAMILGTILTLWNLVGLVAVPMQSSYDAVRWVALNEILMGLIAQSLPMVVLGWFTLKRRPAAIYAGTLVAAAAFAFAISLYVGYTRLNSIQSRPFDALSALLLIMSAIGVILYLIALYAQRKRAASEKR
ncbi:serine/threonine-protein kinase [Roseimaritima ulvae]|uniref:non-specific serine/threonine protein kinase n=1 Tax=Roseimaritima ulvae TaxID=980254 RepID=A0A5B9QXU6_9BACT|nr:serine/threonine-protein kinase [Roseimaritima ulvae]QEG43828.1 Serine/threonine-protein kinase PknB [Roseimaritima ulvae]